MFKRLYSNSRKPRIFNSESLRSLKFGRPENKQSLKVKRSFFTLFLLYYLYWGIIVLFLRIVIRILKIASKLLEMYTIPASNLYFTLRKISKSIMKSRTVPKLKQFFWKMIRNLNPSKWRVISQRCTNILKWRHSDWWLKM